MTDGQARRDQMAEVLCRWWDDENGGDDFGHRGVEFPCNLCKQAADALLPLLARIEREAKTEALRVIENGPILRRWIDDSELVDLANVRAALDEPTGEA